MNKLPGQLLYACFEQGPFYQMELVEACLAFPSLARFHRKQEKKLLGYLCKINTKDGYRCCRGTLSREGFKIMEGVSWALEEHVLEQKDFVFLTTWLYEQDTVVMTCQCRWQKQDLGLPNLKNLTQAMDWMFDHGTEVQCSCYARGPGQILLGFLFSCPLSRVLDPKLIISIQQKQCFESMAQSIKRSTRERYKLFDVLAWMACRSPGEKAIQTSRDKFNSE